MSRYTENNIEIPTFVIFLFEIVVGIGICGVARLI